MSQDELNIISETNPEVKILVEDKTPEVGVKVGSLPDVIIVASASVGSPGSEGPPGPPGPSSSYFYYLYMGEGISPGDGQIYGNAPLLHNVTELYISYYDLSGMGVSRIFPTYPDGTIILIESAEFWNATWSLNSVGLDDENSKITLGVDFLNSTSDELGPMASTSLIVVPQGSPGPAGEDGLPGPPGPEGPPGSGGGSSRLVYPLYGGSTDPIDSGGGAFEIGIRFGVTVEGCRLTRVSYFKSAGESGSHTIRLWNEKTGALIDSWLVTSESAGGWQAQEISTPVDLDANIDYLLSVNTVTTYTRGELFTAGRVNGPVKTRSATPGGPANTYPCYSATPGSMPNTTGASDYSVQPHVESDPVGMPAT